AERRRPGGGPAAAATGRLRPPPDQAGRPRRADAPAGDAPRTAPRLVPVSRDAESSERSAFTRRAPLRRLRVAANPNGDPHRGEHNARSPSGLDGGDPGPPRGVVPSAPRRLPGAAGGTPPSAGARAGARHRPAPHPRRDR